MIKKIKTIRKSGGVVLCVLSPINLNLQENGGSKIV